MAVQDRAAPSPAIGDPVAADKVKGYIRSLGGPPRFNVYFKLDGWRWECRVPLAELRWDDLARCWRTAAPETEAEARAAHGDR